MTDIAIVDQQPVMALIERMATDPAVDVEKLERLMAMHERLLERRARDEYAVAFVGLKPLLPRIARTKHNTQTGSMYAPLEDINKIVDPILHEAGFATSTKVISQSPTEVTVRAELWHIGGHVEHTDVSVPIDDKGIFGKVNKTLPHAVASTITYGKRIAVCALLNISTGDDRDGNLPPKGYSSYGESESADGRQNAVESSPTNPPALDRAQLIETAMDWAAAGMEVLKNQIGKKTRAHRELRDELGHELVAQLQEIARKADKQAANIPSPSRSRAPVGEEDPAGT